MSILSKLLLLFVIVPVAELAILVRLGQSIGFLPTLAVVLGTGALGAFVARAQGLRAIWDFQSELAKGRLPVRALWDGAAILIGAAFLVTPGLLTDLTGLALLFPPTRRRIQGIVRRKIERGIRNGTIHVVTATGGMSPEGSVHDSDSHGSSATPRSDREIII